MIEFASNVAKFAFTELFAFMTNYDFNSRMSFDSSNIETAKRLSIRERVLIQKTSTITKKMKDIWDFIKKKLANAQDTQKGYVDQKRKFSSEYKIEDMIWLFIKNIKIERSFSKLNHKWIDLYKIWKILKEVCQLKLYSSMKIHDTFYTFLLRSAVTNPLIEQIQLSSSLIVINEEDEYEVNDILDSRYHYEKLQYKVAWIEYSSNRAW
jgi:hypothetical protein